jgi:penicillin-binding protein 1C
MGCDGLALTLSQALARRPGPLPAAGGEDIAPHLAARVARSTAPGQPMRSTLDAGLQRMALSALRRQVSELRGHNVEDGALVVLDNASGEVLAWVGSAGPLSRAGEVDAVLARRQPGSTIKPFVYALALQQRLLTAGSLIDDAPLQLAAAGSLYAPQNYDHGYKGAVSVRAALASSLNVPAVRVGAMLGPQALFDTLGAAGLRPSESAGYHGHALALGVAEVTLLDLANAYRMLANRGRITPSRWTPGAPPAGSTSSRQVFEPAAAFVVADMLADPAARATTFGLDSPLVTRGWAAVKTGTSKDLRDNWCVGFTSRYTVGVWVGNATGAPMQGVSGVSGAAPVWREVVAYLHANEPARAPTPPNGLRAAGGEWFLAGTEPARQPKALAAPFGILSPRDGSIVVLDPDIPMAAQRLVLEGAAGRWRLDGQDLGQGTRLRWLPRPGRHVLEWMDGAAVADRVVFEVRAAAPPGTAPRRKPG